MENKRSSLNDKDLEEVMKYLDRMHVKSEQSVHWLPIECAPQSGMLILLYTKDEQYIVGHWKKLSMIGNWYSPHSNLRIFDPILWTLIPRIKE